MLKHFIDYIAAQHLFAPGQEVLLAVSGGRDSASLCHLMHAAGYRFAVAHCNFHLRPGDCDRDEQFVRRLAQRYGVECYVAQFATREAAAQSGLSIEEEARKERYAFFAQLLREHGFACVATAHHLDDSIETFFLNLLRGTGIAGLHGILPRSTGPAEMLATTEMQASSATAVEKAYNLPPQEMSATASGQPLPRKGGSAAASEFAMPVAGTAAAASGRTRGEEGNPATSSAASPAEEGNVVHPLLCFSREEIDRYIQAQGLDYVEDYTNHQPDYRRNQIRLQLIPLLRQLSPNFSHAMATTIHHLADAEQVYRQSVEQLRRRIVVAEGAPAAGAVRIALRHIAALQPQRTLLFELLSPYGFSIGVAEDLLEGLSRPSQQTFFSATHRISREPDAIIIEPLSLLPDAMQRHPLPLIAVPSDVLAAVPGSTLTSAQSDTKTATRSNILAASTDDTLLAAPSDTPPGAPADSLLLGAARLSWRVQALTDQPFHKQDWLLPPCSAGFDLAHLRQPLLLRRWQEGDRFQPFGMKGTQLLSDYFSDHKFSLRQKETVWLLCDACGTILWIVGHRAAAVACLSTATRHAVVFTLH